MKPPRAAKKRRPQPPAAPADKAIWYRESGPKKVAAYLTDDEAKTLRRLARQFQCFVIDSGSGHPVPSTRALVQAIAAGRLAVCRVQYMPIPPPPPHGGCPKD